MNRAKSAVRLRNTDGTKLITSNLNHRNLSVHKFDNGIIRDNGLWYISEYIEIELIEVFSGVCVKNTREVVAISHLTTTKMHLVNGNDEPRHNPLNFLPTQNV